MEWCISASRIRAFNGRTQPQDINLLFKFCGQIIVGKRFCVGSITVWLNLTWKRPTRDLNLPLFSTCEMKNVHHDYWTENPRSIKLPRLLVWNRRSHQSKQKSLMFNFSPPSPPPRHSGVRLQYFSLTFNPHYE